MFISHQSLGVCSCSLIGISSLRPLKPNSCFMPFPPKTKSVSPPVFLSLYMAILSFLWSVTQTKITGVILDSPLSGKPYIQLISKFPCFCFQTTSGIQLPFFLCCFCCYSPGYSHHNRCPPFYLYLPTIYSQYRSQTEPLKCHTWSSHSVTSNRLKIKSTVPKVLRLYCWAIGGLPSSYPLNFSPDLPPSALHNRPRAFLVVVQSLTRVSLFAIPWPHTKLLCPPLPSGVFLPQGIGTCSLHCMEIFCPRKSLSLGVCWNIRDAPSVEPWERQCSGCGKSHCIIYWITTLSTYCVPDTCQARSKQHRMGHRTAACRQPQGVVECLSCA